MSRPVYRFATFRLDVAARELHADGNLLTVSPKVFDGLVWLIEHRERAVGRDELIAAIWGRVDVTDAQLGQLMRKLRRLVGDDGGEQAMVRTVPRFGYRWVAETHLVDDSDPIEETAATAAPPAVPAATESTPAAPPTRRKRRALAFGAVIACASSLALGAWAWHRHVATADLKNAVAVLPVVVDPEGDAESAWLRLGLMDQIAECLRAAGLRVVPSNNIAATARNDGTPLLGEQRVGAATGAGRFVVASVHRIASGWVSRIEWHDGNGRVLREVEANADSAVAATRRAGDQLLLALGRPDAHGDAQGDAAAGQWQQRTDAAMLDTDYSAARGLLDTAPADAHGSTPWLLRHADLDLATERMDAAKREYLELLARTPAIDAVARARALIGLSGPIAQEGDLGAAQDKLGEAIDILRGLDSPQLLGQALYGRGTFRMVQGRLDEADADFSQARIAFDLAGDSLQMARLQGHQATLLALRHRHAQALAMWSSAADRFERFGDAEKFVDALGNCATEQLSLLQAQAALATIQRAEPWLPRLDHPLSEALFDFARARALAANGRLHEARDRFDALLRGPAIHEIVGMTAAIQVELAQLDFGQGNAASAARLAETAMHGLSIPALTSSAYARIRNGGWLVLVRALRASGEADRAAEEIERVTQAADGGGIGPIQRQLAQAEAASPTDPAAATKAYESALAAAATDGAPADLAEVAVSYATALIQSGQMAKATTVAGRIAEWADTDFDCAQMQARLYLALHQPEAFARALARMRALAGERPLPADLLAAAAQLH